jgi:hypothetical protein
MALLCIPIGAFIGFAIGMILGGAKAGGKVVDVQAPYVVVEGGDRGCSGAMKQLGIAAIGTIIGALIGGVGTVMLSAALN